MTASPRPSANLAATLLHAADWFNDELLTRLAADGWPRLNRTHSLVFMYLGTGVHRPAELARRTGITRQSMQTLLAGLQHHGLVALDPDPVDGRGRRVRLTADGQRMTARAGQILRELEQALAERIGADAVAALRAALGRDWGPRPGAAVNPAAVHPTAASPTAANPAAASPAAAVHPVGGPAVNMPEPAQSTSSNHQEHP